MQTERFQISGAVDGQLAKLVANALEKAKSYQGKVTEELLAIAGMSGRKYRYFINNLVQSVPDARYLEIGSWAGSTLCSAIYDNTVTALAIDNWSEFGGPVSQFFTNVGKFISVKNKISLKTSNFRDVDYATIGKYNVYLFDGPHEKRDQYDGLVFALPALDDEFVFIVDDWNWLQVREGSFEAIEAAGCKIVYSVEIFSTKGSVHPGDVGLPRDQDSDWHNGYFLSVLKKV